MAVAVKILVCDLISELLAHALVFGSFFHAAWAIPPACLKTVLNKFYNLFIFIQNYFHNITFCRHLLRQTVLPLLTQQSEHVSIGIPFLITNYQKGGFLALLRKHSERSTSSTAFVVFAKNHLKIRTFRCCAFLRIRNRRLRYGFCKANDRNSTRRTLMGVSHKGTETLLP